MQQQFQLSRWAMATACLGAVLLSACGSGKGPSGNTAPNPDAATVEMQWVLGGGELLVGTEDMKVPLGMNLRLVIESDQEESLVFEGYDLAAKIPADTVYNLEFAAYKLGRYPVRLQPSNRKLGVLNVYEQ